MRSTGLPDAAAIDFEKSSDVALLVGVRLQVGVDPFLERLGADVALEHAQHGGAFLVGDRVERLVDLRRRRHVGVNRPRRLQRVEAERGLVLRRFVDVDVPVGCAAASGLFAIQVANPSFSQMSSHHCIVTRSPNHWCAISCARIDAIFFRVSTDADFDSASRSVSR